MNFKIFAIFDKKALFFTPPFVNRNKAEGLRTFDELVNDSQTRFNKYPSDFQIFELGEWDERTATIIVHPKPLFLEEAMAFVKKDKKI